MKRIGTDNRKRLRFHRLLTVLGVFLMLTAALCLAQGNVSYERQERIMTPEERVRETADSGAEILEPECLLVWSDDDMGALGREMMESVLGQMRVPYDICGDKEISQVVWTDYQTVVLSVTDLGQMGDSLLDLLNWVEEGGGLMLTYPPEANGIFQSVGGQLGIEQIGNHYVEVSGLHFPREFMIGGQEKDYQITDPYESSLTVELSDDSLVYLESQDEYPTPLIWRKTLGEGTVVVDNLGFLEKGYRGFYSASYALLQDVFAYPVINSSTFYIDDFPSPVPGGNSEYIERDYHMSVSDFYTNVWWNDIYNLGEAYGIRYTGMVIEEYSDQVEGSFERNQDVRRFRYFGNMLLDQGGEIGLHGYNHMPLCLPGFDYKGGYDSYKLWKSYEDMKASIEELEGFCEELFPGERFQVYVPPSNILSEEGRRMLAEETDVRAIASVYLPSYDGIPYEQEFEVAGDGVIETPRVISGYLLDDYMQVVALSELNFHFVNSHFQHPDDALDADRGAELGWEEMYGRLSDYVEWLYGAAPGIRSLTGTEFAAAVQTYDSLTVERQLSAQDLTLTLDGFQKEAWLMVRINEGTPGEVEGGTLTRLQEGLYLLEAEKPIVKIVLEKDMK